MSSVRSRRIFFRRVGEALSPYQLLEAFLKIYIQKAHLLIQRLLLECARRCVANPVPFHYPRSEYENAPLERLIKMFQRHSNNKALIQRLRDALKARNYIAHKVIEDYMDHHETRPPSVTKQILRKLKKLEDEGYDLVEELERDLKKLDDGYDLHRESEIGSRLNI